MSSFKNLPITNLSKENIEQEWPGLMSAIQDCSFISIDIEMSGLGSRRNLNSSSVEERYKHIVQAASTFSCLSLGISCFMLKRSVLTDNDSNKITVENKTFNILTLCAESFMLEPDSIKFLISHGFDFNEHFASGIEYTKGNDRTEVEKKSSSRRDYGRELVAEICKLATPIVLHNGLIDLIFLYENFYAKCPDSFMKFVADLSDMFKGGVFDTKYIADYHAGSKASFLEYLYKYALYENTQNKKAVGNKRFVDLIAYGETSGFFTLADFNLDLYETVALAREELEERLCKNYSVYGYCDRVASKKCVKVHCVDEILKIELTKKLKNNKKLKLESEVVSKQPSESNSVSSVNITPVENKTHSAGLDAFMTGYVMLNYLNKFGKFQLKFDYDLTQRQLSDFVDLNEFMGSGEFQNNVYLTGKDYPLMVKKSNFTSLSQNHVEKKARLALKNETE